MASIIEDNVIQASAHPRFSFSNTAASQVADNAPMNPSPPSVPSIIGDGKDTGSLQKQEADERGSLLQLASPIRFHEDSDAIATKPSALPSSNDTCQMDVDDVEAGNDLPDIKIRTEWLGTSVLHTGLSLDLQYRNQIDTIINYRAAVVHDLTLSPYDPFLYLDLNRIDTKLGFCDTALSMAYRGIQLVEAGLDKPYHPTLGAKVRKATARKLGARSEYTVEDQLGSLHLDLYRDFSNGCLGTQCYWDGLVEMKKALKMFPGDADLLMFRELLLQGFKNKNQEVEDSGNNHKGILALTRTGGIFTKVYPWLDKDLNLRTPNLIEQINEKFGAGNCKVTPMIFGPPVFGPECPPNHLKKARDMGPLGVFATRDIKAGEIIMADKCLTGLSLTPSSKLENCDVCHAILCFPYIHPNEIIIPDCCGKVAFCSRECHSIAVKGYHKFLCGKNFDWLYEDLPLSDDPAGTRWRPVMLVRILAIVLADREADKVAGKTSPHILQHPLLARMTAAYASDEMYYPLKESDYQLFENVIAPTRILTSMGIDIFKNLEFEPAVIQTIYWRLENNANRSTHNLKSKTSSKLIKPAQKQNENTERLYKILSEDESAEISEEGATNMFAINLDYLFLNHSCRPNITWHGSMPEPSAGAAWLVGVNGEMHKPGSSTIFCRAGLDIKKGEELKISYIGNPTLDGELTDVPLADLTEAEIELRDRRWAKRRWMEKWFSGGCGCDVCERENKVEAKSAAKEQALKLATGGAPAWNWNELKEC